MTIQQVFITANMNKFASDSELNNMNGGMVNGGDSLRQHEPQWNPQIFVWIAANSKPISFNQIAENCACLDNQNCTILDYFGRLETIFLIIQLHIETIHCSLLIIYR